MSTLPVTVTVAGLVSIPGQSEALSSRRPVDESGALVAAARQGDRAAFGRLVELHEAAALRTALVALGLREDAEDAVQEAFVLAWRELPGFRGQATFRTWLLAIVWRRALTRRKSRGRWWRRSAEWPSDVESVGLAAEGGSPERLAIDKEYRRAVAQAIARLPTKLRDALLLAVSTEYTYEEIARLQRVRVGTIKWRVFEARRIVRIQLERLENGS